MHILTKRHEAVLICIYRVKLEIEERDSENIVAYLKCIYISRYYIFCEKRDTVIIVWKYPAISMQ